MEKKNFNHGTMVGGIVRIVIALIAVLIAIIVISSGIKSYDPEDKFGTIFSIFEIARSLYRCIQCRA
mgnify:CR=1 FL=1